MAKITDIVLGLKKEGLKIVKDKQKCYYGIFYEGEDRQAYPIHSHEFEIGVRKLLYKRYGILLQNSDYQSLLQVLEFDFDNDAEEVEVAVRVYKDDEIYLYELNKDGDCVCISDGEIEITQADGVIFKHAIDYASNVTPDFNVEPKELLQYVKKHFNVTTEYEVKLLSVYLVSCFWGMDINHPVLILSGEKGSSKSTMLRKLERLIDPKSSDLGGIPKGTDGLALRLANVFFTPIDNLSRISKQTSDLLCRSCTGGTVSKRELYSNTNEVVLNIKSLVALNGVSVVARESDLLDRSLLVKLQRIDATSIRTEKDIFQSFEEDRPKILGCCFLALAQAMKDDTPIKTKKLVRMSDFHTACIRIGRVLGISEEDVTEILWRNYRNVCKQSLDEDVIALCIMKIMEHQKQYVGSVTDLMQDIAYVAQEQGISPQLLPKAPNMLSRRLNQLKSNLESEGIYYTIKNIGLFKQIEIERRKKG